ncbi:hypothetical protein AHMF7605_08760 [Adhaeribacter arboris]|uniref:DUF4249 domain-containing protein n=1 Tax=Adhaeribacter arboris TaxID=2072846 RepID=A0A2T2YDL8_9BACT|nr:DUF4249 domain-containing protein [Adhaeribacter arboris]PSR53609.1 hypothetical protein AHMF7605_08760 [Adhaeribacter arboris]
MLTSGRSYLLFLGNLLFFTGCNLEKDIDINLPPYQSQMVVECYLEPGKPVRLSLIESSSYLAKPDITIIQDAAVTISRNGVPETLTYGVGMDEVTQKFYTYTTNGVLQANPGDVFTLTITDPRGRQLVGTTTILPLVKIDTVEFNFNDKGQALVLTKFKDDGNTEDYYQYSIHRDSLLHEAEIEYTSPDELNNGKPFVFGTGYDFDPGDSVIVTLHHLDKAFFDFKESVDEAKNANGNPFAQPGRVKSTVQGGLGVFTNLVYDRKKLVVPPKK